MLELHIAAIRKLLLFCVWVFAFSCVVKCECVHVCERIFSILLFE